MLMNYQILMFVMLVQEVVQLIVRTLEETGSVLMSYVLHFVTVWRKKFVEVLRCQNFICVNSLLLTLKAIIPNLYIASRGLYFCNTNVYVRSRKYKKSSYVNTLYVETDKQAFFFRSIVLNWKIN
jgi:hypothetical protein